MLVLYTMPRVSAVKGEILLQSWMKATQHSEIDDRVLIMLASREAVVVGQRGGSVGRRQEYDGHVMIFPVAATRARWGDLKVGIESTSGMVCGVLWALTTTYLHCGVVLLPWSTPSR